MEATTAAVSIKLTTYCPQLTTSYLLVHGGDECGAQLALGSLELEEVGGRIWDRGGAHTRALDPWVLPGWPHGGGEVGDVVTFRARTVAPALELP